MAYKQATDFGRLPSDQLGIENAWLAWMVNQTVWLEGSAIDAKLQERDSRGKLKYKPEDVFANHRKPQPKGSITVLIENSEGTDFTF